MILKIKNKKGFTLVEVLIAMAIISIVTLSFFTIVNFSIRQNLKNEQNIILRNIAQTEVENLRKEIKMYKNYMEIPTDNLLIKIPDETKGIDWNNGNISITSNGIYKDFIGINDDGSKDNSIIQYDRNIDGNCYRVKLDLSRIEKKEKFLYDVNVNVKLKNNYFSEQEVVLNTKILSK